MDFQECSHSYYYTYHRANTRAFPCSPWNVIVLTSISTPTHTHIILGPTVGFSCLRKPLTRMRKGSCVYLLEKLLRVTPENFSRYDWVYFVIFFFRRMVKRRTERCYWFYHMNFRQFPFFQYLLVSQLKPQSGEIPFHYILLGEDVKWNKDHIWVNLVLSSPTILESIM